MPEDRSQPDGPTIRLPVVFKSASSEPAPDPVIYLAGGGGYNQLDRVNPVTPPEWGRLAAESLSNNCFYEFPGWGHGVMRSNVCGLEIGLQFLDDPTSKPDISCIDELTGPDFE